ncbi:MAG: GGDEF/EAL domain-containing response regulator, partial [Planctomycetota bacterium]
SHLPVIILTASSDTENKLRALDLGATDFLAKPVDPSELVLRVRNTLAAKAYMDQLAYYDVLTGLPNRKMFLEHFDWTLKKAQRYEDDLALLNIELDNFDQINDTIGLGAGDEVLRQMARRIEGAVRSVDVHGHCTQDKVTVKNLSRLDGSVFSLLLDRIRDPENAARVADRIIQAVSQPIKLEGSDIYVTASIGIAVFPADSQDCMALLRLASSAKDYAKNNGGDSFQFSSTDINQIYIGRRGLEDKLRKALPEEKLVLYYQPKVDIGKGNIQGVEALLRYKDVDDRIMPPSKFMPLAEETGLIISFGEWILHEACTQLVKWHRAGRIPISMSVNISVKQFADEEFLAVVKRIIKNTGFDPQFLTLELTEGLLLEDMENKIHMLNELKETGIQLSIDDFGTGYSSLNYLGRLPVDELKIDQSFIMDLSENSANRAIVSSVIFLAHNLGLVTVAEGVETKEQLHMLQLMGCDQYQGFFFSRPVPNAELYDLLPAGN